MLKTENLPRNIKLIRATAKKTQIEFGELVGLSGDAISTYELGRTEPDELILEKIAEIGGVTVDDLLNKKLYEKNISISATSDSGDEYKITKKNQQPSFKGIPVYDVESHAGMIGIVNKQMPEILGYIDIPEAKGADCVIRNVGHCMYNVISNGDWIALKRITDLEVIKFGNTHVIVTDEQLLTRYIHKGKDKNHWLLRAHNKHFDEFELPIKKVSYLFIVICIVKSI